MVRLKRSARDCTGSTTQPNSTVVIAKGRRSEGALAF